MIYVNQGQVGSDKFCEASFGDFLMNENPFSVGLRQIKL